MKWKLYKEEVAQSVTVELSDWTYERFIDAMKDYAESYREESEMGGGAMFEYNANLRRDAKDWLQYNAGRVPGNLDYARKVVIDTNQGQIDLDELCSKLLKGDENLFKESKRRKLHKEANDYVKGSGAREALRKYILHQFSKKYELASKTGNWNMAEWIMPNDLLDNYGVTRDEFIEIVIPSLEEKGLIHIDTMGPDKWWVHI